uniref:Uncharacterized protein n=1 Tax=Tetradesmus obliquus TaxID=3088 RepID=A0A383WNR5_TETOB|eukprot:jgi/Sobl393_1/5251/SZX79051.1
MSPLSNLEEFEGCVGLGQGSVLPTQLQRLRLGSYNNSSVVLPAQLQQLRLRQCSSIAGITALQQLQELSLGVRFEDQGQLLRLAQLPSLQRLVLSYCGTDQAAATAPAWQQLRQLQELSVRVIPNTQQADGVMCGILACSQLAKLDLRIGVILTRRLAMYRCIAG